MKKLLLSFMALFLAFGTAMAQDDKTEDSVVFGLTSVNPEDGGLVTSVDRIQMVFTKDVTVTLPAEGIAVTNTATNEVVKITRLFENPLMPKNNVIFQFEQKMQADKDGKEEPVDQTINTPGSYTYTIPTGCIKSADGEEFAERTFTFSVVGTFGVVSYSPVTTDKLENIEVAFDKEITEVKLPNSGLSVVNFSWTPVATVTNATISDDKKTVTLALDKAITEQGQYEMDLYQGIFLSADGVSQYRTLTFNVVDSKPSFSTNYEDGSKVKELSNVLEITFNNVNEVKLAEGEDAPNFSVYPPNGAEFVGKATCENNKITVEFEGMPMPTEPGEYEYIFNIPAGAFTMDGVANEVRNIAVVLYTVEITSLQIVNIYPTEKTVDQLDRVIIKFNQAVNLSMDADFQQISREIYLTCGDQKYTLTINGNYYVSTLDQIEYLVNAEWDYTKNEFVVNPITAAGTYTLDVSQIVVDYGGEWSTEGPWIDTWHAKNGSCEGTYTWTIGGTGIKAIDTEDGEQAIYDLLGRRVEKITGTGIYIVNGKKVVIK